MMQVHYSGKHFVMANNKHDAGALLWQALCKSPIINMMQVHYFGKRFVMTNIKHDVGALLWQALCKSPIINMMQVPTLASTL